MNNKTQQCVCLVCLFLILEFASSQAEASTFSNPLPVMRHVGKWSAPPKRIPTAMMFDSPIVGNGDAGMTFGGPPEHTTFYISSNSFWSANQVVDAAPSYSQSPGGAESYTQLRIGDIQFSVPALSNANYTAIQSLANATIRGEYVSPLCNLSHESIVTRGEMDPNIVLTTISISGTGCGNATIQLQSGYLAGHFGNSSAAVASTDPASTNNTLIISRESVSTTINTVTASLCYISGQQKGSQLWTVLAEPNGVAADEFTLALEDGRCIQTVEVHGAVKLTISEAGGRCNDWKLVKMGPAPIYPDLPHQPGYATFPGLVGGQPETQDFICKAPDLNFTVCIPQAAAACNTSIWCESFAVYNCPGMPGYNGDIDSAPDCYTQFYNSNKTNGAYADTGWNLWRKQGAPGPPPPTMPGGYVLINNVGECAGLDSELNFLISGVNCSTATRWAYNLTSMHFYPTNMQDTWGNGRCLTAVEPNPLVVAALATSVVDSAGKLVTPSAITTDRNRISSMVLNLSAMQDGPYVLITSVVTTGNCTGCDSRPTAAIPIAAAMLQRAVSDIQLRKSEHAAWWSNYWRSGAKIDLGPSHQVLEGFYYGMHYQIGSASRANRFAPGLWGPWLTSETCGWSGDYTLNYNFEANFYGIFSDNRPDLAAPYFQTILNHIDLAKWRAGMARWGSGKSSATPGFWAQDFNRMSQLSTDKTGFVDAGYKGIQFPTHLSPWKHFYFVSDWGQKNVGSFVTKAFMDFYDYTANKTFLSDVLYPLTKLNGEFYGSYMEKINGKYNVMHSCAMEGCGSQGPLTSSNINVSNNPPFDLAFTKRIFRSLLEYSQALDVDADLRPTWQDYLTNIADYPLTKDEFGNTVFAQATLNPGPTSIVTDGFPNASHCTWQKKVNPGNSAGAETSECGNARYPITFFNAMHPGEDIDLASEPNIVSIARRTTAVINDINDYSPTNGICMAWPASARVVNSSEFLLTKFEMSLNDTMMNNFIPFIDNRPTGGSGCNIENSGATVAVNDLLASVHGHGTDAALYLFPGGWPKGESVRFSDIRIRGAFTISASATGTDTGVAMTAPVSVTSLAGSTLNFVYNWGAKYAKPTITCNGDAIYAKQTGKSTWTFQTNPNQIYTIE